MKFCVIDNYDSFVFNLVRYMRENENIEQVDVFRNDEVDHESLTNYDGFLLSPGPGIPSEAGDLMKIIEFAEQNNKPLLGVCLGYQAIGEHYGAQLAPAPTIMHGKSSVIAVDPETTLYRSLDKSQEVGRYHSWHLKNTFPDSLLVTGKMEDLVMSFEHKELPHMGVQYHPESLLTPNGRTMINNWIISCKNK